MQVCPPTGVRRHLQSLPSCLCWRSCTLLSSALAQDVLTYHNNNVRSGVNSKETMLTPANVNSANFGRLFTVSADGLVDAQPLSVSAVTIS